MNNNNNRWQYWWKVAMWIGGIFIILLICILSGVTIYIYYASRNECHNKNLADQNSIVKKISSCVTSKQCSLSNPEGPLPAKHSWTDVIGGPLDQGNTTDCWAYATCQAMEGMYNIQFGKPGNITKLSVRHLRKIMSQYKNYTLKDSCAHENVEHFLDYLVNENITILTKECYRSSGVKKCTRSVGVSCYKRFKCTTLQEMSRLLHFHGPLLTHLNHKSDSLTNYSGGVITEGYGVCSKSSMIPITPCCNCCRYPSMWNPKLSSEKCCGDLACSDFNFTHVALNIGYNLSAKQLYYIVRNTSGKSYGEGGSILFGMNETFGLSANIIALQTYESGEH